MKSEEVTVTEAARNFADCINRAHYQGVTFVLLKNGKPVARIVPETGGRRGAAEDLAEALSKTKLSDDEARAWRKDLKAARKTLKPPIDKWR